MSETPETASEIQEIRFKLESIEATQRLLVRDRSSSLMEDYIALFQRHSDLDRVYLAIDGNRTQADIVRYLVGQGPTISQPTVSRRLQTLLEYELIDVSFKNSGGDVYEKNRIIERVLRLSKVLR